MKPTDRYNVWTIDYKLTFQKKQDIGQLKLAFGPQDCIHGKKTDLRLVLELYTTYVTLHK